MMTRSSERTFRQHEDIAKSTPGGRSTTRRGASRLFPFFDGGSTVNSYNAQRYATHAYYWDSITIRLPKPSCVSVTSITYVDLTGVTQTLSPDSYYVDTSSEPA